MPKVHIFDTFTLLVSENKIAFFFFFFNKDDTASYFFWAFFSHFLLQILLGDTVYVGLLYVGHQFLLPHIFEKISMKNF